MTRKDVDSRNTPTATDRPHSPRPPRSKALREHCADLRKERSCQGRAINTPWPNAQTHQPLQVPERDCSQGQRLRVQPARRPPHIPRAGQPAQVAMRVTGGELRPVIGLLPIDLPTVAAAPRGGTDTHGSKHAFERLV